MATQTKTKSKSNTSTNSNTGKHVDETVERIRDLNERIIDGARKTGNAYLDTYEKALKSIADYEERVGSQSQVDWVSTMTQAHADFTRDVAKIYTSTARELLK